MFCRAENEIQSIEFPASVPKGLLEAERPLNPRVTKLLLNPGLVADYYGQLERVKFVVVSSEGPVTIELPLVIEESHE